MAILFVTPDFGRQPAPNVIPAQADKSRSSRGPRSSQASAPHERWMQDACGSLARSLKTLGHEITVLAPLPSNLDPAKEGMARRLSGVEVDLAGETLRCNLYDGRTSGGLDALLLEHDLLAHLGETDEQGLKAQALFGAALVRLAERESQFELVHLHGWECSLATCMVRQAGDIATVLTLPDALLPRDLPRSQVEKLGLSEVLEESGAEPSAGLAAIRSATYLTSRQTSATFAREQENGHHDEGAEDHSPLGSAIIARRGAFTAVCDGLDASVWNPVTDPQLVGRYTSFDLTGKALCKSDLQKELGLEVCPDVAVLGAIEDAAGITRLLDIAADLVRNDVQVVVQALDERSEDLDGLLQIADRFPDRLQVRVGTSSKRSHRIVSGSDVLVQLSPSPTLTMAAKRYGTLPLTGRNGPGREYVVNLDAKLETGNGFLYDSDSGTQENGDLLGTLQRSIAAFNRGSVFEALRGRIMQQDHSWERTARLYEHVYGNIPR